ncbi:unnamed protein product, partial [Ectocarpus sp. 8 AP-2014]
RSRLRDIAHPHSKGLRPAAASEKRGRRWWRRLGRVQQAWRRFCTDQPRRERSFLLAEAGPTSMAPRSWATTNIRLVAPTAAAAAAAHNGGSGGGKHTARDLLSPAFSQNSSRRRIEFHKATKPSTIFSPSGGPTTTTAAARRVDDNSSAGGQKPRTNGGEGAGSREGVAGGVDDLARLAEKKIGLPPPGK